MIVSRRTFALGFTAAAVAASAGAHREGTGAGPAILERRVYERESVMPSRRLLVRNGIVPVSIRPTAQRVDYIFAFTSLESRAHAWDCFNCDPEWCALRAAGSVRLREIRLLV
jgi:hypothetical protein